MNDSYYQYDDQIRSYAERRAFEKAYFIDANIRTEIPVERTFLGSGKYELEVTHYNQGKGGWDYTRGVINRLPQGERFPTREIIADVKRNYSHFWYAYVGHHTNGNDYLLCGEDYQGQTVVNLTKKEIIVHFPDDGYDGIGFCWAAAYPSPDFKVLAVDGCYWACPYEMVFYEFTNPDSLPYREIKRFDCHYNSKGWKDNNTFLATTMKYNDNDDSEVESEIELTVNG